MRAQNKRTTSVLLEMSVIVLQLTVSVCAWSSRFLSVARYTSTALGATGDTTVSNRFHAKTRSSHLAPRKIRVQSNVKNDRRNRSKLPLSRFSHRTSDGSGAGLTRILWPSNLLCKPLQTLLQQESYQNRCKRVAPLCFGLKHAVHNGIRVLFQRSKRAFLLFKCHKGNHCIKLQVPLQVRVDFSVDAFNPLLQSDDTLLDAFGCNFFLIGL
jgi:hypothetical protein